MPICLKTWIRFEKSPTSGSRSTTKNAPIGHWESCHPDCSGNRQKTLHLHCLLDGGDYRSTSMIQNKDLNPNPLVSIVIPTFNRAMALNRCLDGLVDQTFKNFEVLVCDDGSTDNTKEIVEKFTSSLNIKYYYDKNFGGPARPRNVGIRIARGKYIAFLDSDDWWLPDKLAVSVEALEAEVDLVYHDLYVFHENKNKKKFKKIKTRELDSPIFDDLLMNGNGINNSTVVVRKSILEKAGNISEDRYLISAEDYDAWLRVSKISDRFKRLSGCYGYYSKGSDNITNAERTEKCVLRIAEVYYNKNENTYPYWINFSLARAYLKQHKLKESLKYAFRMKTQLFPLLRHLLRVVCQK